MTLKELVSNCENVTDSTKIMVYNTLDDYEWNSSNWNEIGVDTAKELNWKIAKFRIYQYTNRLFVALA